MTPSSDDMARTGEQSVSKRTGERSRITGRHAARDHAVQLFGVTDAHGHDAPAGTTLVIFRDLAAVISAADYERITVDDTVLMEYVRVVDATYAHGPVIPAPPGTIFQSPSSLMHWMEVHYAKLHETLGIIERRSSPNAPYDTVRMQFGA